MASRSLNRVMLIGNLTRDPELRYTPQGTAVCTFGVATNRSWVSDGQMQESTEFHRIVAWQKLAELCSQLLFKGRKVFVGGRLQTRKWTGADGQERTTTEIVIDNMIVLDSRRREGDGSYVASEPVRRPQPAAVADDTAAIEDKKEKVEKKKIEVKTARRVRKKTEDAKKLDKPEPKEEVRADDIPF